ncbi:regulator RcnB of Ni and Co efflux [Paraburkholderia fungorum]|uniref:Regulator RcnB of Ni and Co efflux n=1 Tax=Paraburkholderia fungorum TaxID=134537 RepID=A0A1H1IQH4_9BURK|nr:RcnB family protein [Paraburkholderia fungorum]SDR39947.1 regulator RcnB of Ni and Co efflux [Paraburkholderia fungorum]
MKSRNIVPLLVVSLLGTSVAAFAQQHDDNHGGHGGPQSHGGPGPSHGGPQHGGGHGPAPREASIDRPGGPVPHNDWHKGERLPQEYRDRNYVVDDWRGHGLHQPPRGYQWVGVNGDYVLAAIATGVIANVLLSGH